MKLSGSILRVILIHQKDASQKKSTIKEPSNDEDDKFTDSDSEDDDDELYDHDPFNSKSIDSRPVPIKDKQQVATQIDI